MMNGTNGFAAHLKGSAKGPQGAVNGERDVNESKMH